MDQSWKKHLLKSGLPFEYEVKECFIECGCTVWDEYSYLRQDEDDKVKEFSYDLDVNYWDNENSFTFMVECKYKTIPTKWFFLPDPYSYQEDLEATSFLHTIDYFSKNKFVFDKHPFCNLVEPLAPFCLKGVEVYQDQFLETNIFKAINQLSFAFIEQFIASIDSQLNTTGFTDTRFFNIPIIVTNADLYIINEKLKTYDIEQANNIEGISVKKDFLFFHNKIGKKLISHNKDRLVKYFDEIGNDVFYDNNYSFATELPHFIEVISERYCPQVIVIMNHDSLHENYTKLFQYINSLSNPSEDLIRKKEKAEIAFNEKYRKK